MTVKTGDPSPTTPANQGAPAGPAAAPDPEKAAGSAAVPASGAAPDPAVDSLRAEMMRDRFEAAAARAGVGEAYVEVAQSLFQKTGKEPTKENMTAFIVELKKKSPALFGPQPANTGPTPSAHAPSSPAPGDVATPFQQWQSLEAAGRKAEAEAYYRLNRHAINRTAA